MRRLIPAIVLVAVAIVLAIDPARHELVNILTWPEGTGKHGGYNFWSGNTAPNPWDLGALLAFVKHKNCHVKGCWRIGHYHPDHGLPSCRRHRDVAPSNLCPIGTD